jgi:DNA-directed RNA polymerase subunit F
MTPHESMPGWVHEIRERLVAIETKLEQYNRTEDTARHAKAVAENAAEDIRELKTESVENRKEAAYAAKLAESNTEKITKLEGEKIWLQRVIYGAVALAVLDLVVGVGSQIGG